ncbi:MAG: DUF4920 domain-containing protein [Flavobacteriales bacterium]|nr:DUF4920 domain-containing protein [Flavobacteriales bacterium]
MKKISYLLMVLFVLTTFNSQAQTKTKKVTSAYNVNDYASFGAKFQPNKVLTEKQMLKKYKSLKKGDSVKVQFKSIINSVCKKKGCWMNMDLSDGQKSFVKFKDYAFFVPLNADNSEAIISGTAFVTVVSVDELRHYAKDAGKPQAEINKITKPEVTYSFMADGVLIKN